jgi:signal transduction histidine kinase
MSKPLRVLIVEDVEADAILLVRELARAGFETSHERVETPEAMRAALGRERWDMVLSDYSMPRFSAPEALALVKELKLDLPFIIVSGTVGEDVAVEALRAGAHDFMTKGRLIRLGPAVERELREAGIRAEQLRMREQLLISERMASVGTLAAGIAHELNNPLTPLMANLTFIADDLAQVFALSTAIDHALDRGDPEARDVTTRLRTRLRDVELAVRDARDSAERVRNIVRDLKIFSRTDEERTGPVDVRRVIDSSLRIAWNEVRHRARLVKDYREVPLVEANEGRLGQVVLNLLVNAAHAITDGHADDNEIRISTSVEGGFVQIAISDTGTGIPEHMQHRIFEPFFTTKPVGVGTGLGLSICHRIVTGFGGTITVASEVGRGTTFRIVLPRARREDSGERPAPLIDPVPRRRGRILVIDDEPMITKALGRTLAADHAVISVGSAGEAMALLATAPPFDVILCDIMMPQMTGVELYDELRRRDPALADRIIFLTGGAFTSSTRAFLDSVSNQRVEKPFDPHHLRTLISDRIR